MSDRFLREPECRRLTGLSRSTRWRLERQRHFPKRRRMSPRTVGWLESELREWLVDRPAASSSDGEAGVTRDPESRT